MKTMQKAIAVLLACFFMTSVFAATAPAQPNGQAAATATATATAPAPAAHKKCGKKCKHMMYCKKHSGAKSCHSMMKKSAPAAIPATTN